jgi:peptide/nickel transport system ATP-binding protein
MSLTVAQGEILGLVGESGSGKSVCALSVLRLLPKRSATISGSIRFRGEELTTASERRVRQIRGKEISMVFQEAALNPSFTIGRQIVESLRIHEGLRGAAARTRALESLQSVGIPDAKQRLDEYPHQLSGGMRQRVMIAIALVCNPKLLLADEPTTALDVTIQAQILRLLTSLCRASNMGMILVTHDLGVVADVADRVVVMYAGQLMEEATVDELFRRPLHPYTEGLLRSTPRLDDPPKARMRVIKGGLPSPYEPTVGCPFSARCEYALDRCHNEMPPIEVSDGHKVACWRHAELTLVGERAGDPVGGLQ